MLIVYPNPALHQKSIDVQFPLDKELIKYIADMYPAMETYGGIGLSAIQLNKPLNLFILSIDGMRQTIINPVIIESSEEHSYNKEGCLSIPGLWTHIRRPEIIKVQFVDEQGEQHTKNYSGLWARAFQHEYDHLNGLTMFDRMSTLQAQSALKKYKKSIIKL